MHSFLLYQFLIQEILSDEQQLTILWQCPKFIGYEKLELVYLITDFLHLRSYRIMIGYSLLTLTLYLVGYLAGIHQCLYTTLYRLGALGYLTDNLHVAGSSGALWLKDFDSSWDDQCNAVATSIRNITTARKEADHHVYDLGGRVVRNNSQTEDIKGLNKGIYVYNNKKYVAK